MQVVLLDDFRNIVRSKVTTKCKHISEDAAVKSSLGLNIDKVGRNISNKRPDYATVSCRRAPQKGSTLNNLVLIEFVVLK